YLDGLLEQLIPAYSTTRKHYRRALSQRNALLKSLHKPSQEQLFVWNLRLSELGAVMARSRADLVVEISKQLPALYNKISGAKKTSVSIKYVSKIPIEGYESVLISTLEKNYE